MSLLSKAIAIFSGLVRGQACDSLLSGTGVIQSEGYPNSYPRNYECTWKIQVSGAMTVELFRVFSKSLFQTHLIVNKGKLCAILIKYSFIRFAPINTLLFQADDEDTIILQFEDFSLEPGKECQFDSLSITSEDKITKYLPNFNFSDLRNLLDIEKIISNHLNHCIC